MTPPSTFEVFGGDAIAVVEFNNSEYLTEHSKLCSTLFEVTGKYSTRDVIETIDLGIEGGAYWTVFGLTDAQVIQIKMLW